MGADYRIHLEVETSVDRHGDASTHRTWIVTNLTDEPLDFTDYRFTVEITSRDVILEGFVSDAACEPNASTEKIGLGNTAIHCDFSMTVPPRGTQTLRLRYRQPRYMSRIHSASAWAVSEYFAKTQFAGPYKQEEPQILKFVLRVTDPRGEFLGLRSPLRSWILDASEHCPCEFKRNERVLTYTRGLATNDKLPDFHVLSLIDDRSILLLALGAVASALGSYGLQSFFEGIV
jgi:hypothetical protein